VAVAPPDDPLRGGTAGEARPLLAAKDIAQLERRRAPRCGAGAGAAEPARAVFGATEE
jgi:hypothetical protein